MTRPPWGLQRIIWRAPSYLCAHILPLDCGLDFVNVWSLQAGLFAGTLTAFIVDRYQNLQQTPAQQSAFFLQQSTVLLNQISYQLSSLGAQFPANLSLPGYNFHPSASDVRVNTYWFMSLVFSLSAALLATLVQRWAWDYMHIFRRYGHPLKIARMRQFLYEGVRHWRMRAIAEAVPGLIHISLFLFLIGLADFLFATYSAVGKFTIIPIAFSAAIYIFSTIAPVFNPQSPYRTAFSDMVWYIIRQCLCRRYYKGRHGASGDNMTDVQMYLAMESNGARRGRDERAIQWLIGNLTEDIEMESLASGIPGSFDADWGLKVWTGDPGLKYASTNRNSTASPPPPPHSPSLLKRRSTFGSLISSINPFFGMQYPGNSVSPIHYNQSPHPRLDPNFNLTPSSPRPLSPRPLSPRPMSINEEDSCIKGICRRIRRLFETCEHRDSFTGEDEWRKRSRACVETTASFIFCMHADISEFGEIGRVLSELGNAEKTRDASSASLNLSFILRWTCLSIVVIRKQLNSSKQQENALAAMQSFLTVEAGDDLSPLEQARAMDKQFVAAWRCVDKLRYAFKNKSDRRGDKLKVEETLRGHEYQPELAKIYEQARQMEKVDEWISKFQNEIDRDTHNLIRLLPGVVFDDLVGSMPIGKVFDFLVSPVQPQFIYLSPRLQSLSTLSQRRSSMGYVEIAEVLDAIPDSVGSAVAKHQFMERQFWRLQDISEGGALGFTLELFLLSLRQVLPPTNLSTNRSPSRDMLYAGAFEAITSDWKQRKESPGTLQIILNIGCDFALRDHGIFSNFEYPRCIIKSFLELLRNMVEGRKDSSIDDALKELTQSDEWRYRDYDPKTTEESSSWIFEEVMGIIRDRPGGPSDPS